MCEIKARHAIQCATAQQSGRWCRPDVIETDVWETRDDGYIHWVKQREIQEIRHELDLCLKGMEFEDYDGFSDMLRWDKITDWPKGTIWVAPITGESEGHYIHVLVACKGSGYDEGEVKTVLLAKTFAGWDEAWAIAKRTAELLGI